MKPLIFVILAVAALGIFINDPQNQAEGNAVMSSVSDTVDPFLQKGFSTDAQETAEVQSKQAAEFVQQAGEEFGLELTFEANK